jgi:hypothetical protein
MLFGWQNRIDFGVLARTLANRLIFRLTSKSGREKDAMLRREYIFRHEFVLDSLDLEFFSMNVSVIFCLMALAAFLFMKTCVLSEGTFGFLRPTRKLILSSKDMRIATRKCLREFLHTPDARQLHVMLFQ